MEGTESSTEGMQWSAEHQAKMEWDHTTRHDIRIDDGRDLWWTDLDIRIQEGLDIWAVVEVVTKLQGPNVLLYICLPFLNWRLVHFAVSSGARASRTWEGKGEQQQVSFTDSPLVGLSVKLSDFVFPLLFKKKQKKRISYIFLPLIFSSRFIDS